jgi:hypothetical protein
MVAPLVPRRPPGRVEAKLTNEKGPFHAKLQKSKTSKPQKSIYDDYGKLGNSVAFGKPTAYDRNVATFAPMERRVAQERIVA